MFTILFKRHILHLLFQILFRKKSSSTIPIALFNFGTQLVNVKYYILHITYYIGYSGTNPSSIGTSCYRAADCCAFVLDVTNENSFNELNGIKDYFWTYCEEPQLPLFLIANKIDREDRKVTVKNVKSSFF